MAYFDGNYKRSYRGDEVCKISLNFTTYRSLVII